LRVVRGNAKDLTLPPPDSEEFAFLARRLRYDSAEQLRRDVAAQMNAVRHVTAAMGRYFEGIAHAPLTHHAV
jgi:glutamate-ammonia-ligase adenylyltransferase